MKTRRLSTPSPLFYPQKIKRLFLIFLAALFIQFSHAQTYYAGGAAGLYEITISGGSCSATFIGPFIDPSTGNNVFAGDIAICPDGSIYITDNTNLWSVDPLTAECTLVASSSTYLGIVGLGCAANGQLYGSAFNVNGVTGGLYLMNPVAGTITLVGETGFNSAGDIANYNGTWYMTSTAGLVEVDVNNPSNSTLVQPGISYVAMTVFPNDCNTLLGGDGNSLFTIDINNGTVNSLCTVPGVQMGGLTTISEFSTIPNICEPTIDLDGNNSSGAVENDFNAPDFNCSNFSGVNIADLDTQINTDEDIQSLTITIASGNADGPNEILELLAANNISISGSGTGTITLTNSGSASLVDFVDAITSVIYQNQLVPPTPGLREIEVSYTTIPGSQSNVAICFLNVDAFDNLEVDLGPNLSLCPNEEAVLNAGNPGADYLWSNGSTSQIITTNPPGTFSVTVSDGVNCPGSDEIVLTQEPIYSIDLSGDDLICENGVAELTFSFSDPAPQINVMINESPSGDQIFLQNVVDGFSFPVSPSATSTYTIDFIEDNGFCIDNFLGVTWTVSVGENFSVQESFQICEGDSIFLAGAWQSISGVYIENLLTFQGCDSTVENTLMVLPSSTSFLTSTTCDPSSAGVFQTVWPAANGCDSTIFETVTFVEIPVTEVSQTSCDPSQVGVNSETFPSYLGCDSIVVTTTTLLPSGVTELTATSCNPDDVGIFTEVLSNQDGCDSTVITTISFSLSDTTEIFGTSCDPDDVGTSAQIFTNQNGCDSTVITTISFSLSDTTEIFGTSCDPDDVGTSAQTFTNQNGCDSTVITTISFSLSDTTEIFGTSCDPDDVGTSSLIFTNQNGCDSTVITTISFSLSDTTEIFGTSCDPDDVGTSSLIFTNQNGCDSTVITTISFVLSDTTEIFETSCDPDDVGTSSLIFTNQNGCDSTVITTISFAQSDTTEIFGTSCDPDDVGTSAQIFTNQNGCDSTVITTVSLTPIDDTFIFTTTCNPDSAGIVVDVFTSQVGCDSVVFTQTDLLPSDTVLFSFESCDPDDVGVFTEIFSNQFGCDSLVVTEVNLSTGAPTLVSTTSCNPDDVGTFTEIFTDQFGCDSTVITTISLSPSDETFITSQTCDPSQSGVFTSVFANQFGCDSIVTTTIELLPSDTSFLVSQTCDPTGVGSFTDVFSNQFGCDSTVISTVSLSLSDTIFLFENTCDLDEVGIFENTLTNQAGCDSTIILEISLSEADTTYLTSTTCETSEAGIFTENFAITGSCDSVVITTIELLSPSLTIINESTCEETEAGVFEITLSSANGCDSIVTTVVSLLPIEDCEVARPSVYVPNAFSPNADGINDYFLIFGNEEVREVVTFQIFSRWGERVFEAYNTPPNDIQSGWDGSFRGEPMGTAVFVFWAEVEMMDGSRQMLKGDVMLVR